MSDYKQNETTRFPNVLFRSISQQKKLHRVSLVEFEEFKYVISGSANLRSSDNLEQISIEENEELYNFNIKIHDEIIKEFKTINKSIKTKRLWQVVAKNTQE